MKHFKTGMLVTMTLLIAMTITILSCSKDDDPTPPVAPTPTITSFTPAAASTGETVTITGTNLTGATAVSFGGTPASSFTVANATTITAKPGAGASGDVKVTTPGGSATKSGFTFTAPQIDGYDNSNQVGKDSLIAHWTFDDTQAEAVSGAVPVKSIKATYATGVIGNGLSLDTGYLVYPTIAALNSADVIPSYTISLWVNSPASTPTFSSFFQLTGTNFPNIWGQVDVAANTHWGFHEDTLALETSIIQITAAHGVVEDHWNLDPHADAAVTFKGASKWSLLTVTYDGPTHTLSMYANGSLLASKNSTVVVDPETFILEAPIQTLIGTFAFTDDGFVNSAKAIDRPWAGHGIKATLDDIRVFKAPLNAAQIKALYDLGLAGR